MNKTSMHIGWVGLGKMGAPMAARVRRGGYALSVYDVSPSTVATAAEDGVHVAVSLAELAAGSDAVVSMISDDKALLDVALSSHGIFAAAATGLTFIDMSTVSPQASARVAAAAAQRGVQYLRAPVSGSVDNAAAGQLTVLVSGPRDVHDRWVDLFECMGETIHYVGATEQARTLKLAVNLVVGSTAAIMGEALAFGEKGGVDWRQMIDVFATSSVASPLVRYKADMLRQRAFAPMFTISQMAKDLDLALGAGNAASVAMPLTSLSRQLLSAMMASGRGDLDFFACVMLFEELAGLSSGKAG